MCGRYAVTSAPEAIRALFGYPEQPNFPPRYNVAPTQPIAIVRLIEGKRQFALVRWGLLPSWVKDPKNFTLLINARGESVIDKPAFRAAMKCRRCLIPADGFYEWKATGTGKQPYLRSREVGPAARVCRSMGNLDSGPNGEELETAAIVTTRANRTLADIHDRMPVIVPPEAFDLWLDCTTCRRRNGRRRGDCARAPRICSRPMRSRPRSTAQPTRDRNWSNGTWRGRTPSGFPRRRAHVRAPGEPQKQKMTGRGCCFEFRQQQEPFRGGCI